MGMKLFDDVEDDDIEKISQIEVNEEFAKRYEHNKKREDLQKLEEMKKKGLVHDSASETESESDTDFEEEDVEGSKNEVKFLDALLKVRNKDPILQEKDAKLFESSDDEDDDDNDVKKKEKKVKPKYLKDVIAQHLIEEGPEGEEDEENDDVEEREGGERVKSYVEEQEELRKEVLRAMEEAERGVEGEGEEFWREKEGDEEGSEDEEVKKRLDEYFGEDEGLDEKDMFLKDFFKNKLWIDREKGKGKVEEEGKEEFAALSDDEEVVEKMEDYERDYNFRFEENKSDRVLGHSRVVEGSVRKEANARKSQRERKKERMAQAEAERREEVKRLKNLKRKEIQEKLSKIREVAGIDEGSIPLDEEDLEEDFDPVKFDKKMSEAFGEEYYGKDDDELEVGSEGESDLDKPDFGKEDELLGLPKEWDVIKSKDGFSGEREKLKKISEVENENDDDDQVQEGGEGDEVKKRRKRKKSAIKEVLDKELEEELYKLDYEDSIGDLKTRFKYREVKPSKYGLSAAEILMLDEKELNQYVSLKKLAPYREKEWKVPQMRKQMLYQGLLKDKPNQKKRRINDDGDIGGTNSEKGSVEVVKVQNGESSVDESKLSRAARRRRKMKEKKLPESRLIAYGKIPASSKNKSKK